MEIDLRQTPELLLSAPDAATALAEKMADALLTVEADPSVTANRELLEKAQTREELLSKAHAALNNRYVEIFRWLADITPAYIESLIESAGSDGKRPDQKVASRVIAEENESRLLGRAIDRIVSHLKPLAEIARLRAHEQLQYERARVMDTLAKERGQRLIGALSAAVGEETAVSVDTRSGAIGMLLAMSGEATKAAFSHKQQADELQAAYDKQNPKGN